MRLFHGFFGLSLIQKHTLEYFLLEVHLGKFRLPCVTSADYISFGGWRNIC
jgi:hypothetical protein